MTTQSDNPHVTGLVLPDVESAGSASANAQCPPARAREASTADGETGSRHTALITGLAPAVLNGESLWHSQPPSLAQVWGKHVVSARYFEGWLFRWPRYIWGAVHIALIAPLYLLAWVTSSPPLLLFTAGVLALVVWLA